MLTHFNHDAGVSAADKCKYDAKSVKYQECNEKTKKRWQLENIINGQPDSCIPVKMTLVPCEGKDRKDSFMFIEIAIYEI